MRQILGGVLGLALLMAGRADAEPARRWYGWQTLLADGAAWTLIVVYTTARPDGPPGPGEAYLGPAIGLIAAGAPTVHALHGRPRMALVSVGLRLAVPARRWRGLRGPDRHRGGRRARSHPGGRRRLRGADVRVGDAGRRSGERRRCGGRGVGVVTTSRDCHTEGEIVWMSQTTVRITRATRAKLREIARREQASMRWVLERAVEEYRRKRFMEAVNAGYAQLRADPAVWKAHEAEAALWERTLGDGLSEEPVEPSLRRPRRRRKPARR